MGIRVLVLVGLLAVLALETPKAQPAADTSAVLYVVGHGWHAGLVVRRSDLAPGQWDEATDAFPEADYLEVGWGDAAYYPAGDPGLGLLLRAALWPTSSVLHIAGFRRPPLSVFPQSEVIRIDLTPRALADLVAFIRAAYRRTEAGTVLDVGPGLYGTSRFYAGRRRYHLFDNCNHWVARALRAAGLPVQPGRAFTVEALLRQVRPLGQAAVSEVQRESR